MSCKYFISFIFVLIITNGYGQNKEQSSKKFPVDIRLNSCMDSTENQTTLGMIDCANRAMESWDAEMNKYYRLLLSKLSENTKVKIQISQRKWLEYRDAEFEAQGNLYSEMEGTMWQVVSANRQLQIVKDRAIELMSYYEDLNLSNN
ncbi:MAG: hypothetical protein K0S44_453 [Bacteroidetes bacterium]|nr:hypothetical protein [Bacteroidota bacterium]